MEKIGYFGLVVESQCFWQGFFLVEDPEAHAGVDRLRSALPEADIGAFSGLVAEGAVERNSSLLNTAGHAVAEELGSNFFVIFARHDGGGWITSIDRLEADTIDDARLELIDHVAVRRIEAERDKIMHQRGTRH